MQQHIGTKIVNAQPMNRAEYNTFRGWALPEDENGEDAGYLVEYLDGGKPNTTSHAGYVSWSPKAQFDAAYIAIGSVGHLEPHQQRLIAESVQLNEKVQKLADFVATATFNGLPHDDRMLLLKQHEAMISYLEILTSRIERIK